MCGRFIQLKRAREKAQRLARRAAAEAARAETYNLTPGTRALAVRKSGQGLVADWLFWGFREGSDSTLAPINARIESAAEKPLFRDAWRSRRCVVPAEGWYEWQTTPGRKQPFYFHRKDEEPIFFAGLWSGDSFCLFTTKADGELAQVHDRRPLVLRDEDARAWIEGPEPSPEKVVFCAVPPTAITFHPVSDHIGNPRHDHPGLIQSITLVPQPVQAELL